MGPSRHVLPSCRVSSPSAAGNLLYRRADRRTDRVACTRLKTIKRPLRGNQARERVEIWYADPSRRVLPSCRVSPPSAAGNPLYRRTDRVARTRLKIIKRSLRGNQARERVEIWYADPSRHVLPSCRVSSPSAAGNPLYRRTDRRTDRVACTRLNTIKRPLRGNQAR